MIFVNTCRQGKVLKHCESIAGMISLFELHVQFHIQAILFEVVWTFIYTGTVDRWRDDLGNYSPGSYWKHPHKVHLLSTVPYLHVACFLNRLCISEDPFSCTIKRYFMHSSHCSAIPGRESLRSALFFTEPVPCPNALCGIAGSVIYGPLSQEQQFPIKGGTTLYSSKLQWCLKWARAVWRSPPNIHLVDMSLGGIPLAAGTQLWEELTSVSACPFCSTLKASVSSALLRSAVTRSRKACWTFVCGHLCHNYSVLLQL